jgi:hypothetical protein
MAKLLTTLQHPDAIINRIQDGSAQVLNPLLKRWYDGFSFGGDCSASIITQRVTLADDWIAPTLLNGWTQKAGYDVVGYRKRDGLVYIKGVIGNASAVEHVFTVAAGYAPSDWTCTPRWSWNGAADSISSVEVGTDGKVYAVRGPAAPLYTSLKCWYVPVDPSPVPNPVFPLTLEHGLKPGRSPKMVLLADAIDVTTAAHVSSSCSWKSYDTTRIQIIDLPDLFATRTYDLTFLVLGGDP